VFKPEPPSHSFLLRVWIESTREESGRLSWRGFIVHLPDEDRSYVQSFDEIRAFICRHLGCADGRGGSEGSAGE